MVEKHHFDSLHILWQCDFFLSFSLTHTHTRHTPPIFVYMRLLFLLLRLQQKRLCTGHNNDQQPIQEGYVRSVIKIAEIIIATTLLRGMHPLVQITRLYYRPRALQHHPGDTSQPLSTEHAQSGRLFYSPETYRLDILHIASVNWHWRIGTDVLFPFRKTLSISLHS